MGGKLRFSGGMVSRERAEERLPAADLKVKAKFLYFGPQALSLSDTLPSRMAHAGREISITRTVLMGCIYMIRMVQKLAVVK